MAARARRFVTSAPRSAAAPRSRLPPAAVPAPQSDAHRGCHAPPAREQGFPLHPCSAHAAQQRFERGEPLAIRRQAKMEHEPSEAEVEYELVTPRHGSPAVACSAPQCPHSRGCRARLAPPPLAGVGWLCLGRWLPAPWPLRWPDPAAAPHWRPQPAAYVRPRYLCPDGARAPASPPRATAAGRRVDSSYSGRVGGLARPLAVGPKSTRLCAARARPSDRRRQRRPGRFGAERKGRTGGRRKR
ncbi:unnamed protein product [Urochloa humidicola]